MTTAPERFGTSLGALVTMVGVAIGLANVWRFPYMMGSYGGSAFLIVYLTCMLLFALPALMAEWALGRATGHGPLLAFRGTLGNRIGTLVGAMVLVTAAVAGSYYVLVIGKVAITGSYAMARGFSPAQMGGLRAALNEFIFQYPVGILLICCSMYISHRGLNAGIARASKITVPLFVATVIYLVVCTFRMDGAWSALARFLQPDFASMGPREYFAVLGQCFFSIGLGGSYMLVYGSYLPDDLSIGRTAILTVLGDTFAALAVALFIMPAVIVLAIPLTTGPSLVFETLPVLFHRMPGGEFVGGLFLLALALVALLSYLPVIEILVDGLTSISRLNLTRSKAIAVVGAMQIVLMLPTAIDPSLISFLDLFFGSGMQLLGSALAVIALSWGLGRSAMLRQGLLPSANRVTALVAATWFRWVVPAGLICVLVVYVKSLIAA